MLQWLGLAKTVFGLVRWIVKLARGEKDTGGRPDRRPVVRAMRVFAEGEYEKAEQLLEQAIAEPLGEAQREECMLALGIARDRLGDHDGAVTTFEEVVRRNPQCAKGWTYLGVAHRNREEDDIAEYCYTKALELEPDQDEALSSLAVLHLLRGRAEEAVALLERAIQIDPHYDVAHANLSVAYAAVGRFTDGRNALKQAAMLGYHAEKVRLVRQQIDALAEAAIMERQADNG